MVEGRTPWICGAESVVNNTQEQILAHLMMELCREEDEGGFDGFLSDWTSAVERRDEEKEEG